MDSEILKIKNLSVKFKTEQGIVSAVNGIDLSLQTCKTVGVVGESGCGKSVTSLAVMRLLNRSMSLIEGNIYYNNIDLLQQNERFMRGIRGNKISMIFQEPMSSLNPVYSIGNQIAEVIEVHHEKLHKKEITEKIIENLKLVGIPSPEKRINEYPHQMSGGMRQRIMIAMALACRPKILIADEPTTALDVTIQAQILELMNEIQQRMNMSIIFITHDLGVIAEVCDDVYVMYCGQIVEKGSVEEIFDNPLHYYTQGLLNSIPKITEEKERLASIRGTVPNPLNLSKGCRYRPRCDNPCEEGKESDPEYYNVSDNHYVKCWRYSKGTA